MILVIGGAFQQKEEYVSEILLPGMEEQGRPAESEAVQEILVISDYQVRIREQMKAGLDPLSEAKKLLAEEKKPLAERERGELVVICDEVGCGLVPVDAFERAWREKVGRVCCYFAGEARQVIRVVCGIGTRIK